MEDMGNRANRRCMRVTVPSDLFRTAGLWLRPWAAPTRLDLLELGAPDLRFSADPAREENPRAAASGLRIDDLSANGMRLTLTRPAELGQKLALLRAPDCLCLVYLQLAHPLATEDVLPLSIFLGTRPVALREEDGWLTLTLNILYRGQPERRDKALTFFYVGEHPIRELAAWCDEVQRLDRLPDPHPARGLQLSRLFFEIDAALAQAERQPFPEPLSKEA